MNTLKKTMRLRGIKQKEIALEIGVSQPTVSDWVNGKKIPEGENLSKLANILGLDPRVILGYAPITEPAPHDGYITIPVFGTIPAGIPIEAIEDILDYEELSAASFSTAHEYFALRIRGNSMYPSYLDGDTVIFRKQNDCENGDDCAVMVNSDDATFKRVKKSEDGIALMPLNPDYDVRFFTNKQIEDIPVRIIGVAVEIRRSLKK